MANATSMPYLSFIGSLSLKNIFSWTCSIAMIFGGLVPFVPQYKEIRRTVNADGFSLYVCLSLLVANTLRIVFWFGHPYEWPLLLQSIIMNLAMLLMVQLCVNVRHQTQILPTKPRFFTEQCKGDVSTLAGDENCFSTSVTTTPPPPLPSIPRSFWDFEAKYFWEWTDFLSYIEFLATFTAVIGILMYFLIDMYIVVELVGFLAVFTESMLGTPQFYRNLKKKSTIGMSKKMVMFWTVGDVFKTAYFILREAPVQFWICGILQVFIDVLILLQVFIYRVKASPVQLLIKGQQHIS